MIKHKWNQSYEDHILFTEPSLQQIVKHNMHVWKEEEDGEMMTVIQHAGLYVE